MMGWLTIKKTIGSYIAGVGACIFLAWLGVSALYRWYSTGELLTYSRGMDNLTKWKLITYESNPFNFVGHFAVDVVMAALGLWFCVGQCLLIRKWWRNRPQSTPE